MSLLKAIGLFGLLVVPRLLIYVTGEISPFLTIAIPLILATLIVVQVIDQ
jgi:hypothetical protein